MALTPSIQSEQGRTLGVTKAVTTQINTPQGRTLGVYNVPTTSMQAEQARTLVVEKSNTALHATQAVTLVVCRGRIDNFNMRAYTVTIDGHDWYVLQAGESGTLVYDTLTSEWVTWDNLPRDIPNFRGDAGLNWNSPTNFNSQSDVLIGDDLTGMIYYLDPFQNYDGDAFDASATTINKFTRVLTGGISNRGRGTTPCNFVFLTGSLGRPLSGSSIVLNVSDDYGNTYVNCGAIAVDTDFNQDITWMSLGSFGAPGRIFQIQDDGGLERIDSLDMN